MSVLHRMTDGQYVFHCPGCECGHAVTVNGVRNGQGASWQWNGSLDTPTFSPSINCNATDASLRCHSFVRDGRIQFLSDSYHRLAGQTVDLPDWDS